MTDTNSTGLLHRPPLVEKIPAGKLPNLPFWKDLDEPSQQHLQQTIQRISQELSIQLKSTLRLGREVEELRLQTEPHGAFGRTLDAIWGKVFSKTTAYRFRNIYITVRDTLSEHVVELAIASGIDLVTGDDRRPFGAYTEIVQSIPAPKKDSVSEAKRWMDEFQSKVIQMPHGPRGAHARSVNTTELGCRAYKSFRNCFRQLPADNKIRSRFLAEHIGYAMRLGGISNTHSFEPATPPAKWEQGRGRPKESGRKKAA